MTEPTTEATEAPVADATPDEPIADESSTDEAEPDTFPREVVEKLRQENGKYRQRAQQADTYATRLHTELVRATGRLADPTDLEFDEEHLEDPDALAAAVDDLLSRKPHLASRKPAGDIGQGQRGAKSEPFSLLGLLKSAPDPTKLLVTGLAPTDCPARPRRRQCEARTVRSGDH